MDIRALWTAVLAQDEEAIRPFFHPDARVDWVCTNERFTLDEYITANCRYPGAWEGEPSTVNRSAKAGAWMISSQAGPLAAIRSRTIRVASGKMSANSLAPQGTDLQAGAGYPVQQGQVPLQSRLPGPYRRQGQAALQALVEEVVEGHHQPEELRRLVHKGGPVGHQGVRDGGLRSRWGIT